jgi:hypothetical protein
MNERTSCDNDGERFVSNVPSSQIASFIYVTFITLFVLSAPIRADMYAGGLFPRPETLQSRRANEQVSCSSSTATRGLFKSLKCPFDGRDRRIVFRYVYLMFAPARKEAVWLEGSLSAPFLGPKGSIPSYYLLLLSCRASPESFEQQSLSFSSVDAAAAFLSLEGQAFEARAVKSRFRALAKVRVSIPLPARYLVARYSLPLRSLP